MRCATRARSIPCGAERRAQLAGCVIEGRRRHARRPQPHEDQAADLGHGGTAQPVRVGVEVLAAAAEQPPVQRVAPLVIGAHPAAGVARLLGAHRHAAVAAGVVQRAQLAVLAARDDHRVAGLQREAEEVAGLARLGAHPGKQPAGAPDRRRARGRGSRGPARTRAAARDPGGARRAPRPARSRAGQLGRRPTWASSSR